jgi:hypothetical protein
MSRPVAVYRLLAPHTLNRKKRLVVCPMAASRLPSSAKQVKLVRLAPAI